MRPVDMDAVHAVSWFWGIGSFRMPPASFVSRKYEVPVQGLLCLDRLAFGKVLLGDAQGIALSEGGRTLFRLDTQGLDVFVQCFFHGVVIRG